MKRIVITGATSMIGSALVRHALDQGVEVLALIRGDSRRLPSHPGLRVEICPLSEFASFHDSSPWNMFFHLAWDKTTGSQRDDVDKQLANVSYTLDAVRLAQRLGCQVFVGAGSQAEYGPVNSDLTPDLPVNPHSGYGVAKLAAGKLSGLLSAQLGIRHTWVRILSVYGPGDGPNTLISFCIREMLRGCEPALTPCEQTWDYLYRDDAARALYSLGQSGSGVYCLGSGEGRPLREYVEELRDIVAPGLSLGFGRKEYYSHQPMHLRADLSALIRDTGFTPTVSFSQGIRNTTDWMKRNRCL